MITLDFETYPIEKGSPISPTPCGVAVKYGDNPSSYMAWTHTSVNTTSIEKVIDTLRKIADSAEPLLFHNAKFDLAVLSDHFAIRIPPERINDSMILAYLNDPRESTYALKELIVKHCGVKPDERDELKAWILKNVRAATEATWGSYIYAAPVPLVSQYACADTDMTYQLFNTLKHNLGL